MPLAALFAALVCIVILSACELKTYNMIDPGSPSDAFAAFYRAVSDGDDETVNQLLYNYVWHSYTPEVENGRQVYEINGLMISGSDYGVISSVIKSRKCLLVSESDYTGNSLTSSVTIEYTSFDISKFQTELASQSVSEVKREKAKGKVFKDESDTREVIEGLKEKLLKNPEQFYSTRKYKISLVCVKGKWKIMLTEDFYKALLGYSD